VSTTLVVVGGGGSALVVGRIEPRGYQRPLISSATVEEVEVEGSTAARWPVRTEHRDLEDWRCHNGAERMERTSGGGVRNSRDRISIHLVNERVFIPSTQRRWGVGGGGLCLCKAGWHWPFLDHAVSAPTGYMDRALCWANKAVVHASPFKHGPDGHV
jgi:hypothetical protein